MVLVLSGMIWNGICGVGGKIIAISWFNLKLLISHSFSCGVYGALIVSASLKPPQSQRVGAARHRSVDAAAFTTTPLSLDLV